MSSPSQSLWLSMEPRLAYTQLHLTQPGVGTLMKARLSSAPVHGGVSTLLEALSAWQGLPLVAVLDADAEEVSRCPERWARLMGEAEQSPRVTVEWSSPSQAPLFRDRFFDKMGDFAASRRMLTHAATGLR